MGKNEIHWAIFNGKTMLPFTIRTTRKQCLEERNRWLGKYGKTVEEFGEECKKVVINEYVKT